jgi:hypothetical protein
LEGAGITAEGVAALVGSDVVAGFTWLGLGHNDIGDEGAEAVAASPHLSELTHLSIYQIGMTDAGARAMARSSRLPRHLKLWTVDNPLSRAGKEALRVRFGGGAGVL